MISDYEINKRLAEIILGKEIKENNYTFRSGESLYYDCGTKRNILVRDYCNNPSDIMPLVIEHKVHTAFNGKSWYAESWSNGYSRGESENYYKAAALCLIKTLDNERLTDKVNADENHKKRWIYV